MCEPSVCVCVCVCVCFVFYYSNKIKLYFRMFLTQFVDGKRDNNNGH